MEAQVPVPVAQEVRPVPVREIHQAPVPVVQEVRPVPVPVAQEVRPVQAPVQGIYVASMQIVVQVAAAVVSVLRLTVCRV